METEATSSESPIDESDALDAATIVGPIEMDASESGLAHPIDERSTQRDRRQFGEYELLEEIARGGMGVVYRARHRRLDRIVALKMILGGRFSGADEVQRFYVEAKAASRLDHPGIVPLYEIGEVNDQPFYAMKFIEGGSLSDHLPEIRKDTRRAVSLLHEVAKAVHHAHQRGILHRDLKPANILLDDQDRPLLTDLGLAKQAGEDSGLTQTGALLGTPSYMPPEQAQSGATVTTACDIYSLGAIFYEILTGRPPFVGATPIETVMQVLESSVTPPRETNRGIDQGLELICLKCLSREPSERYATAAEFADDLDRWLAGRPISVRPPSLFASTRQWIRNNRPLLVTSAVTLAAFVLALPVIFSLLGSLRDPGSLYAGDADDPRPRVFMLSRVPSFVSNIAAALVLLLWPSLGLLVATESRKPSIGRALRRAAVLSVIFGSVFTILLGWIFFSLTSHSVAVGPIHNLASVVWLSPEDDREGRLELLYEQVPGLREQAESQRANYLSRRLSADAIARSPFVLGVLILVVVGLSMPVLYGSAIAASLFQRSGSRWLKFVRYYLGWTFLTFGILFIIGAASGGVTVRFGTMGRSFIGPILICPIFPALSYLVLRRWGKKGKIASDAVR